MLVPKAKQTAVTKRKPAELQTTVSTIGFLAETRNYGCFHTVNANGVGSLPSSASTSLIIRNCRYTTRFIVFDLR